MTNKKYSHIFFDLDHTLWDFEKNANECLVQIYEDFDIESMIFASQNEQELEPNSFISNSLEDFLLAFDTVNQRLWSLLDKRQITHQDLRNRRFKEALAVLNVVIETEFSNQLNEEFLRLLPKKSHLIEGAKEILDYLLPNYQLHIITNGFDEVQASKLQSSEISHYFGEIITNEKANARKPEKEIFDYALQLTNAKANESLMVGDNYEADIRGAIGAGIDTVYYNPEADEIEAEKPTFEIKFLSELALFL